MDLEMSLFYLIQGISRENSYIFFLSIILFSILFYFLFFFDRCRGIEALVSKVMVQGVEREIG